MNEKTQDEAKESLNEAQDYGQEMVEKIRRHVNRLICSPDVPETNPEFSETIIDLATADWSHKMSGEEILDIIEEEFDKNGLTLEKPDYLEED